MQHPNISNNILIVLFSVISFTSNLPAMLLVDQFSLWNDPVIPTSKCQFILFLTNRIFAFLSQIQSHPVSNRCNERKPALLINEKWYLVIVIWDTSCSFQIWEFQLPCSFIQFLHIHKMGSRWGRTVTSPQTWWSSEPVLTDGP